MVGVFPPYTTRLEYLLNKNGKGYRYNVINEGVSGECVFMEMATRLPELLKKYKPNLVIILGGTNDLHKLDCKDEVNVFYELKSLHEMSHKLGSKTVAVTIPEADISDENLNVYDARTYRGIRKRVNSNLRDYAGRNVNTTLSDLAKKFPLLSLSAKEKKDLWCDGVHPSRKGYEKMADIIYEDIKDFNF